MVNISGKLKVSFAIIQTVPTEAPCVGKCCFQVQTSELGHLRDPQDMSRIQVLWFRNDSEIDQLQKQKHFLFTFIFRSGRSGRTSIFCVVVLEWREKKKTKNWKKMNYFKQHNDC